MLRQKKKVRSLHLLDDLSDDSYASSQGQFKDAATFHFRIGFVVFGLAFLFTVLVARMFWITFSAPPASIDPVSMPAAIVLPLVRADILDRNGQLLATNLPTVHLFAHPHQVKDKEEAALLLSQAIPELTYTDVLDKLMRDVPFVYLKRHLTPAEQYEANRLGIPGLNFEKTQRRVYPFGALFSHLIGFVNMEHQGVQGVESFYNHQLTDLHTPVRLTVDLGVQQVVRDILMRAMTKFEAKGAISIILDAKEFNVISLVSLPDFDPNFPSDSDPDHLFNKATLGVYEMGSVFKVFNTALALDSGRVRMTDTFDARQPLKLGRHTITDFSPKNRFLSVTETMVYSSNIASALMGIRVGADLQRKYLSLFGFFDPLEMDIPEKARPLVPGSWGETTVASVAYGYGLAVSPLHVVRAVAAVVNGGDIRPVSITPSSSVKPTTPVISRQTSDQLRYLMGQVVEEGSARKASAKDYRLGGKTGTAQKLVNGRYVERKVRTTFIGAFPIEDPAYVILVMLDEPKRRPGEPFNAAGWNVAPTAGEIIDLVAPMLGVAGTK